MWQGEICDCAATQKPPHQTPVNYTDGKHNPKWWSNAVPCIKHGYDSHRKCRLKRCSCEELEKDPSQVTHAVLCRAVGAVPWGPCRGADTSAVRGLGGPPRHAGSQGPPRCIGLRYGSPGTLGSPTPASGRCRLPAPPSPRRSALHRRVKADPSPERPGRGRQKPESGPLPSG